MAELYTTFEVKASDCNALFIGILVYLLIFLECYNLFYQKLHPKSTHNDTQHMVKLEQGKNKASAPQGHRLHTAMSSMHPLLIQGLMGVILYLRMKCVDCLKF